MKSALLLLALLGSGASACEGLLTISPVKTNRVVNALAREIEPTAFVIESSTAKQLIQKLRVSKDTFYWAAAQFAAQKGIRPISSFPVGAAGVTPDGSVILGANIEIENTELSKAFHAERAAVYMAHEVGASLVSLYSTVTPCGGCRQWLNETHGSAALKIVSRDNAGNVYSTTLPELLPRDFGPKHLGESGMLDGNLKRWDVRSAQALPLDLLRSVERSYAPYSKSPSGAVIILKSGLKVSGSYIEQAAYESYSALAVAVAKLTMMGLFNPADIDQVQVAFLAQNRVINHKGLTEFLAHSDALGLKPEQLKFFTNFEVAPK